jgi:hypothetical protein
MLFFGWLHRPGLPGPGTNAVHGTTVNPGLQGQALQYTSLIVIFVKCKA